MYFKYSDGSLIQLVKARYTRTDPQVLSTYHVPLTDVNGAIPLGLDWQTWTISGVIADPQSVQWRDIIWLSLDNVSWRACRVQATAFPKNLYQQSQYEVTVLVSPILEGAAVRYPTTGYKWFNQSITGISQPGNVTAKPIIHYLAPLFYAPLSNTLVDFTGQSVTFTRTAAKYHNGVVYPINAPIFDSGLYLASDTSQDVAMWTPPAATVRTIAMQIKSRYPSPWSIGGGGTNLLTANQSNAETDTTGMMAENGTLTRNTSTPLAGAGDFKVVAAGGGLAYLETHTTLTTTIPGYWYNFQCLVKTNLVGGRVCHLNVLWLKADGVTQAGWSNGNSVMVYNTAILLSLAAQAPALAERAILFVEVLEDAGEIFYVDSLMIEAIPAGLYIWSDSVNGTNNLLIDTVNNLLHCDDYYTGVGVVFPTAAYLNGAVTDIILLDDTAHAVTVIAHAAGGTWYTATETLTVLGWFPLTLGNLEGSIANLVQYPYVLSSAEYQALAYSSLSLLYNTLYVGNRYAGEIVKGSDKRLLNALGSDISALLGGVDISIGSAAVTITQSQGQSARWYVEVKRTDV